MAQLQQYEEEDGRPALKRARSSMSKPSASKAPVQESIAFDIQNAGDPLDYPRRRATIACEVCRSRKSRCDGARPKCKLCTELSADCVYREPGIKLDAGDKLILERLAHIEGLLQSNLLQSPTSGSGPFGPISPATSNTASDADIQSKRMSASVSSVPMAYIHYAEGSHDSGAAPSPVADNTGSRLKAMRSTGLIATRNGSSTTSTTATVPA